jgi:hypothetical protein
MSPDQQESLSGADFCREREPRAFASEVDPLAGSRDAARCEPAVHHVKYTFALQRDGRRSRVLVTGVDQLGVHEHDVLVGEGGGEDEGDLE